MNFIGDKFDNSNPNKYNHTWIARHIRQDLKEVFNKDWKFSVRKGSGSSNSIYISVKKYPADTDIETMTGKIRRIADAYNYDNSDIMTDYFDRNFYLHVYFERI